MGSNPNFNRTPGNNKKRPISPEQVLRLFGSNHHNGAKTNVERPRRSPASSPPSTTHQGSYRVQYGAGNLHELATRTVTMLREPSDSHGFGICVKGGKDSGKKIIINAQQLKPITRHNKTLCFRSVLISMSAKYFSATKNMIRICCFDKSTYLLHEYTATNLFKRNHINNYHLYCNFRSGNP